MKAHNHKAASSQLHLGWVFASIHALFAASLMFELPGISSYQYRRCPPSMSSSVVWSLGKGGMRRDFRKSATMLKKLCSRNEGVIVQYHSASTNALQEASPPPPEMTSVVCEATGTHQKIDNYAYHFPKNEKPAACTYVCRDTRGLLLSAPSACSTTHGISCRSDRCALDGREIAAAGGRDDARTVHYLRYVVRLL